MNTVYRYNPAARPCQGTSVHLFINSAVTCLVYKLVMTNWLVDWLGGWVTGGFLLVV